MSIKVGEKIPAATLMRLAGGRPEPVDLAPMLAGKKVVLFAVPAPFSSTCDAQHMPSFIRVKDALTVKGVDAVICVAVTDPFAMHAWGDSTGANAAGIHMLVDPACEFTEALGLRLDAPVAGLIGRSLRYSMYVEDGIVKQLNFEEKPGVCDFTAGETILEAI